MLDFAWLLLCEPNTRNLRFARLVLSVKRKFTMVENRNLSTLYDLVDQVIGARYLEISWNVGCGTVGQRQLRGL